MDELMAHMDQDTDQELRLWRHDPPLKAGLYLRANDWGKVAAIPAGQQYEYPFKIRVDEIVTADDPRVQPGPYYGPIPTTEF